MDKKEYQDYNRIKGVLAGVAPSREEFKLSRMQKQRWMYSYIKMYKNIIDYGSSNGWLFEVAKKYGVDCVEVDEISEKGSFARCEKTDCVFSVNVLEHMSVDEVNTFLDTCKKLSKDVFLVTNNPECSFSHRVLWDDITHTRLYTYNAIGGLLKAKGFSILEQGFADPVIFRWSNLLLKLWFWHVKNNPLNVLKGLYNRNPYNYWFIHARYEGDTDG